MVIDIFFSVWTAKRETATPPPPQTPTKPALTEEELSKKSTAIIEEYLHINDMKVYTDEEHRSTSSCVTSTKVHF